MKKTIAIALLLTACAESAPAAPPPEPVRIDDALFAPELVMDHQSELGLDESQVRDLELEMRTTQDALVPLEWRLRAAREALAGVVTASQVDEEAAVAAARSVADVETEIEIAHLRLLVRMKNRLTDDQRAQLTAMRVRR